MASIEKRYNKYGAVTAYRITVYEEGQNGNNEARHRITWHPDPGLSDKQVEKALSACAQKFEDEILAGFRTDSLELFSEYAEYVLELKKRNGISPRTLERYHSMMPRINAAIGHLRLTQIRPHHLNELYKNLGETGIRAGGQKAMLKINLRKTLREEGITVVKFAQMTGLSETTIRTANTNGLIAISTAEAIAEALDLDNTDVFKCQCDITALSNKTILEHHRLISSILAQAEKEMLVTYNAAAKATPPKVRQKKPDYYQPDVLNRIIRELDRAPLKWKAITYLLIDTGCRRGEAVGLKWECVDLEEGIITIERTLSYTAKTGIYEGPTKTGNTRVLRIAPQTLEILLEYKEEQEANRRKYGKDWINTGYVFTRENGEWMSPDSVTAWENKFSEKNSLPHIHPHAFRHTAASLMIASGIDIVTAAGELGHADATTTAKIYAHQIATAKAKAANVRGNVFNLTAG